MMISFSRVVKEEIVFNDFDQPCEKAILCAMIKILGNIVTQSVRLNANIKN